MGSGGSKKAAEKAEAKAEPEKKPEAGETPAATPAAAPAATPAAAGPAAAIPAAPLAHWTPPADEVADGPYQIVDPPPPFVVEGLKLAGGVVSDHADVREGRVIQVAKHPSEHMMHYWLKVEYGPGQIAFVHTLMSCGWNSDHCIRAVGDASFPPDEKNLPVSTEAAPAAEDAGEGPSDDAVYKLMEPAEDFVLEGLKSCGGIVADKDDVKHGKILQVAKHPHEPRMQYWLKVEYGESKVALVHMLMSCGWTSDQLLLDVGDVQLPLDPKNMPTSKEGDEGAGGVPLPDLKPADYVQEFVDPSHLDAISSNPFLRSVFPEASEGQVKSIWRGPKGFWLEVSGEPEATRYGAHFLEPEGGRLEEGEHYVINCAVKLGPDEEFPPEPLSTSGKAVAF